AVSPPNLPGPGAPVHDNPSAPLLPEQQVHDPTSADVLPARPTVAQDVRVGTTGDFQGVGQDRQAVEGTVLVDGLDQPADGAAVPRQPAGVDRWGRAERVAEIVPGSRGLALATSLNELLTFTLTAGDLGRAGVSQVERGIASGCKGRPG